MTTTSNASASNPGIVYPRWHTMVSGAAAGAGARFLTAPLDLIKIRLQLLPATTATTAPIGGIGNGINMFQSLQHIIRNEGGIRSLFRGNVAATYLWIGYAAVQFSLYSRTSDFLSSFAAPLPTAIPNPRIVVPPPTTNGSYPPTAPPTPTTPIGTAFLQAIGSNPTAVAFCAGGMAGSAATLATYPFDLCRTALAARGALLPREVVATERTFFQAGTTMSDFFRAAVVGRGLFAGAFPAVLQIVPYMGINFALYEYLQRKAREENGGVGFGTMTAGMAGAIAGGVSKFSVYPLDTVKKRMQAQAFKKFWGMDGPGAIGEVLPYKNMMHCVVRIGKEEGFTAFYRGLVPTVMKSMCATGITFAVFTFTKNSLESFHDQFVRGDDEDKIK